MAQARTSVGDLRGCCRITAALHALEEVAHMIVARMVLFGPLDVLWPDARGRGEEILAHVVDADHAVSSFEDAANRRLRRKAFDDRAASVLGAEKSMRGRREKTSLR